MVARGDMNGYRDFEHGHLRTSSYAKDGYRGPSANGRRYNGAVDDIDHSFDTGGRDGSEPSFEVDHLATYTSKSGTTHPNDGLTKLKQMENTTGIWTMRCLLLIERNNIIIVDKGNGDELERFPLAQVFEPTAVLKNDRRETYNNLVMFTIIEDPRRKNGPSDMHIFQSITAPAHDIVDEILAAKGERPFSKDYGSSRAIPPPPREPAPEPPYGKFANYRETHAPPRDTRPPESQTGRFEDGGRYGASRVGDFRASYVHKEDMDAGQNEALERNVQLLNNCFDDIEKFVSRLQVAAEAYKELERRRVERGNNRKPRSTGDGMLKMRAKPPPAEDFVDIFQKFKFAFNLLAKLKAHIHDPNAPELVHFLFTPLSLIYDASRDPIHEGRELSGEAVSPLLLQEAKQLLVNCLTSKEQELWLRLGKAWTQTKDEWPGYVIPYSPKFYSGWQPLPQSIEDVNHERIRETQGPYAGDYGRREDLYSRDLRATAHDDPYSRDIRPTVREEPYRETRREDPYYSRREEPIYKRELDRRPPSPIPDRHEYVERTDRNKRAGRDPIPPAARSRMDENMNYAQELKRMGATIYEAVNDRQGKNQKELNVEKGDILQVLDKSRNWWKLKNYQGETGYAPYTILKEYQPIDDFDNGGYGRR